MAPYVDIFSGGPDGSLGKAVRTAQAAPQPAQSSINALAPAGPMASSATPSTQSLSREILKNTVGHAALLADTPEKWAGFIGMLKANGIDPAGYGDFEKGRALALGMTGNAEAQA